MRRTQKTRATQNFVNMGLTYKEIFRNEELNTQYIYLHKEGMFWRAHNQSAYLMCRDVDPKLKVSRKYIRKEGQYDYSVGFPEQVLKKWMHNYIMEYMPEGDGVMCYTRVEKPINEIEYQNWCELCCITTSAQKTFSRITSLIEDQPVFKTTWDAMMNCLDVVANVDKRFTDPTGKLTSAQALELLFSVLHFYEEEDREKAAIRICRVVRDLEMYLYILEEKKQCSTDKFNTICEQLNSVHSQIEALGKSAKMKKNSANDAVYNLEESFKDLLVKVNTDPSIIEKYSKRLTFVSTRLNSLCRNVTAK